ncbi:MAG: flavodoxin [Candidatus Woesearchaeota archaeon]
MKTLVLYYSRTGLTKKVAGLLATKLSADIDEIIDGKNRKGAIGYFFAGKDATLKNITDIKWKKNPAVYDLIIIGGPVWAWNITPAIRTYLLMHKDALQEKKLAFFATQGSSGADGKFKVMQEILEKEPLATMTINGKDFKNDRIEEKAGEFIAALQK